jgi:cytochrome c peroxidase
VVADRRRLALRPGGPPTDRNNLVTSFSSFHRQRRWQFLDSLKSADIFNRALGQDVVLQTEEVGKARTVRRLVAGTALVASVAAMSPVIGAESEDAKVKKARRTLISISTLDQMTRLPGELGPLPPVPIPASNPQTPAKIELGKMLFFDPRLSANDHWACATCHSPSFGYGDGLPRSLGFGDEKELNRHSPTVINVAYNSAQFWDGRAATMEDQATGPIVASRR